MENRKEPEDRTTVPESGRSRKEIVKVLKYNLDLLTKHPELYDDSGKSNALSYIKQLDDFLYGTGLV